MYDRYSLAFIAVISACDDDEQRDIYEANTQPLTISPLAYKIVVRF